MSETLVRPDVGDAELISAVRGGDVSAYGLLFERHVESARRLARQLSPSDADDLVSDAFAKVLRVLQNGGGPDVAFRAYLLTAIRRLHVDRARVGARVTTTDEMEKFDPGVPFRDTAVEGFENAAAAAAFASLPERWQLVLWHTEVEGQKPADIAPLLGMSANSVSALAYRAREGLRQAFLNSHISDLDDEHCEWTHEHLGAYVRHGVSKRDAAKVERHLDECRKCMAIYLELTEVNSNLSGILAPLLLGAAGTGYLASTAVAAKGGGALFLMAGRVRDGVTANTPLAAAAGVAAVATAVGLTVALSINGNNGTPVADVPRAPVASSTSTPGDDTTSPTSPGKGDRTAETPLSSLTAPVVPSDLATTPAATGSDGVPGTDGSTDGTTDGTSDGSGDGSTDGSGGNGDGNGNGNGGPTTGPTEPPANRPPRRDGDAEVNLAVGGDDDTVVIDVVAEAGIVDDDGDPIDVTKASLSPTTAGRVEIGAVQARGRVTGDERFVTYHRAESFSGKATIAYTVSDGHDDFTGTITLTVEARNHAPVAVDDEATTAAGQPVTVDVVGNDTDSDGDDLALVSASAAQGEVGVSEGKVVYTPDPDAAPGDYTVSYVVTDGRKQDTGTLIVHVTAAPPVNRAPETQPDNADTGAGQPVTVDVLANDTDPDGDDLGLVSVGGAAHGTVEVVEGKVLYTPNDGWVGGDTMTYVVSDGTDSATGKLTVTTRKAPPVNRDPVTQDDFADTGAGQPVTVDVLANDTDPDGDALGLVSVDGAAHGTVEAVDGKVLYTPEKGWAGPDTVTYVVTDGHGGRATGTLTVTTKAAPPVNRAPETQPDFADTGAGQPVTVDVLANDTDPDGDDLGLVSVGGAAHGTVEVVGGKVVYTPDKGWAGDDTMTYVASDGTDTANGTLTVTTAKTPPPVNRPPKAVEDTALTAFETPVTVDVVDNDTDPDGDELALVSVDGGSHGTATVVDGQVRYTPDKGWFGADNDITYVVSDGTDTDTGRLHVTTRAPGNHAPAAKPDKVTVAAVPANAVTIDVLANDSDPDGDALSIAGVSGVEHGTVEIVGKRLVLHYPADFKGNVEFSYVASDGRDESTATVEATITNDDPKAVADVRTEPVHPGQAVTLDVLGNDTDPNGDALTLVGVGVPSRGTAEIVDGKVVYHAAPRALSGPDSFSYVVRDARGAFALGNVTLTVTAVDLHLVVIHGPNDGDKASLTARVTGYPDGGHIRITITGQAVNAIVGSSMREGCDKQANSWVCTLPGTGEQTDLVVKVDTRGKERALRFEVEGLDFTESLAAVLPNSDVWP